MIQCVPDRDRSKAHEEQLDSEQQTRRPLRIIRIPEQQQHPEQNARDPADHLEAGW